MYHEILNIYGDNDIVGYFRPSTSKIVEKIGFVSRHEYSNGTKKCSGVRQMARPRINIDKSQFEKLCSIQCTLNEIAGFFNCSSDTIERWCVREYKEGFADVYEKKRGLGKISLRRSQFRMAETNPTMAIWLGKQYLGQKDSQELTVNRNDDETIKKMEAYFNEQNSN